MGGCVNLLVQSRRPLTKLLATGQETQYGGMLDDGHYEKGVAKSYTVLTAGQYSGTTNITINAKTDVHSNNCVFDNNTGLMWSRYASASVGVGSDGELPWTTNGNGEGIFTFCAEANNASLGGHADWRIPNFNEVVVLAVWEGADARPDSTAFPSCPLSLWTSTTRVTNADDAWRIDFNRGVEAFYEDKVTDANTTFLVRG